MKSVAEVEETLSLSSAVATLFKPGWGQRNISEDVPMALKGLKI